MQLREFLSIKVYIDTIGSVQAINALKHIHENLNNERLLLLEVLLNGGTASQDATYLPRFGVCIRYDMHSH